MRFLLYTLVFVATVCVAKREPVTLKETVYFSRSCPNGEWYVTDREDDHIALECTYDPEEDK